ncbi:hypothetical protein L9F63_016336, partial [Diploptera punctata]
SRTSGWQSEMRTRRERCLTGKGDAGGKVWQHIPDHSSGSAGNSLGTTHPRNSNAAYTTCNNIMNIRTSRGIVNYISSTDLELRVLDQDKVQLHIILLKDRHEIIFDGKWSRDILVISVILLCCLLCGQFTIWRSNSANGGAVKVTLQVETLQVVIYINLHNYFIHISVYIYIYIYIYIYMGREKQKRKTTRETEGDHHHH